MMSTASAAAQPRSIAALASIVLGIAAVGVMYFPLPLLAAFLGVLALALGSVALLRSGAKLGLLGIILGIAGIGLASPELYHRVTDTGGPPPGAEDAMKGIEGDTGVGIESSPDVSGMQEESASDAASDAASETKEKTPAP